MTKLGTNLSRIIWVFGAMSVLVIPPATASASTERDQVVSVRPSLANFNNFEKLAVQNAPIRRTERSLILAQSNDIGPDGLKRRGDGSIDDDQPGMVLQNDDIGPDGLKRRGDGSIDDDQPGTGFGREHKQLIHSKERNREILDDGTAVRTRTDTWVTPDGAVVRERFETRSVLPDGTKARERVERRFDAEGNVIRERIDVRDVGHSGSRDGVASFDRPERLDRSGKPDRPDRVDRSDSFDRPDRLDDHSGRH